jgi:hypothetical protein
MRAYHVCTKDIAATAKQHASVFHYAELPDGTVLLSSEFSSEEAQSQFEQHVTVQALPHQFDPTPLEAHHVVRFAHIGVVTGHTMKDLKRLAKQKLHRLL